MRGMIIGGFASQRWYYTPLRHLLRRDGLDVSVLDPGPLGLNVWSLETFLSYAVPQLVGVDYLIGHSLGGIQSILLADLFPDQIQRVFAVGSPVWGTPIKLYEQAIMRLLGATPEVFRLFQEEMVPRVAHKLVVLSSKEDTVAPETACVVNAARNYSVDGDHLLIPYRHATRSIIRAELTQVQS